MYVTKIDQELLWKGWEMIKKLNKKQVCTFVETLDVIKFKFTTEIYFGECAHKTIQLLYQHIRVNQRNENEKMKFLLVFVLLAGVIEGSKDQPFVTKDEFAVLQQSLKVKPQWKVSFL